MTRRNFVLTFSFVAFALFPAGPSAFAADSASQVTQSPTACGATVQDDLAAARKALQTDDRATRVALVCLMEAISASTDKHCGHNLNAAPQSGMLHAPVSDAAVAPVSR
jgi:hypothetical protein